MEKTIQQYSCKYYNYNNIENNIYIYIHIYDIYIHIYDIYNIYNIYLYICIYIYYIYMYTYTIQNKRLYVNKFIKLSEIGFPMECFTADFLKFFTKKHQNVALG